MVLNSCGNRSILKTQRTITERIDTTIVVSPDTIHYRTPIHVITEPRVIETERTKVTLHYDTVFQTVMVEAVSKDIEIPVQYERTEVINTSEKSRTNSNAWFFWYIAGIITILAIKFIRS